MDLSLKPPHIYTVSSLTAEIKSILEEGFDYVWVEGEISNFASPLSGHYYMSIKDTKAQIKAVMFRVQARYLKFIPEDGMKVIVRGRLGVYEPRGEYQIILDYLEPLGFGELAAAFEQVKKKLAIEGVFDDEKKKSIPFFPTKIAVITSPTGAAIRDFLRISLRRMPNVEIILAPVRVQGDEAAFDIVEALDIVNENLDVDVIILTRGGGSFEDLWPFNKEEVAYAIRRSHIPVVSAVGHEVDITISDLAADLRAPTPSGAAELVVPEREKIDKELRILFSRLILAIDRIKERMVEKVWRLSSRIKDPRRNLADIWIRLDELYSRLNKTKKIFIHDYVIQLNTVRKRLILSSPLHTIAYLRQQLGFFEHTIGKSLKDFIDKKKAELCFTNDRLYSLNPFSILGRGYSITRKLPDMDVIKDSRQVTAGDSVNILLGRGEIDCVVKKTVDDKKM